MKRCKFFVLLVVLIIANICLTACSEKAVSISNTADYIGIDAAKEFALKAAGISSDLAVFSSAGLDSKNGTFYYQVIFTENGVEYKYDIDALTGVVIEKSYTQPTDTEAQSVITETQLATSDGAATEATSVFQKSPAEASETLESFQEVDFNMALSIALTHAELTEQEIYFSEVETDIENGQKIFEVKFVSSGGAEYEYELNAENGSIIKFDYDAESLFRQAAASGTGIISESQAKQVVQDRVPGAKAENIVIRLKEDDGRMEYKGSLIYDNMEYEFKIDAYSGGMIEWEAELIGW